jgi:hypothetical protein
VSDKTRKYLGFGCLLVAAAVLLHGLSGGVLPIIGSPNAVTAVVYVYEKDDTAVPSGVRAGLNKINRLDRKPKIVATEFEDDTTDGTDSVPDQYKIPLAEFKKHGKPALVVLSGDEVLSVTLEPTTDEQVLGAVK